MSGSESIEPRAPDEDWEGQGYRVGTALGDRHAVVVLGTDHDATALVALGIARAQATQHRVALGDLLGDAPPIQRLISGDDPHGLVDSFMYGVSLNRIAQRVADSGDLYVLPSGTEPPNYAEILPNPRWRRLASGFREENALLVLAAPADAPNLADLVASTDGAVVVGDERTALPADQVIATVSPEQETPAAERTAEGTDELPPAPPLEPAPATRGRIPGRRVIAAVGVALAAGIAALGIWLAARQSTAGHFWSRGHGDTASAAGSLPAVLTPPASNSAGGAAVGELVPADPADSSAVAAYAVALMTMNTLTGTQYEFQQLAQSLPAATYAPVLVQGATWYKVMAGAAPTSTGADSLLQALRARGQLRADAGEVVRVPFAFLVDSAVTTAAVPGLLSYWAKRGQPIYALRQEDGSARLYAGAFESPRQAALFVETLKAAGIAPVLVYRIGRVN